VRILVAPDKFKGSLTAAEAAAAVARGITRVAPAAEVDRCPVADGGEGTVEAAVSAGFTAVTARVTGPTGEPVDAVYARDDTTAVVEFAAASGLGLLPGGRPRALTASSRGTGELIAAALDAGVETVVLGIGGSATTDGGAGMVEALGARLLDDRGTPVPPGGAGLEQFARLELAGLHPRLAQARVVVACDVDNPLLGPAGAAAVYGPQKGAGPAEVARLEHALTHWDRIVSATTGRRHADTPGAGAAGGVGYAALALLGATLRPGIGLMLELVGFADRLRRADLVVTGEGSLDRQTLHGKGPAGVAAAADRAGIPTVAVAGQVRLGTAELAACHFRAAYALVDLEPDRDRCLARAGELLELAAGRLARDWVLPALGPAPVLVTDS
jgi:glycerate kinase